jgi:hypothetical protein
LDEFQRRLEHASELDCTLDVSSQLCQGLNLKGFDFDIQVWKKEEGTNVVRETGNNVIADNDTVDTFL